jgi:hypothetical protein
VAELCPEDSLRLHVLLAAKPLAIRIDENSLQVQALTEQGDRALTLHPSGNIQGYLRLVRELISGQILGSPGGYPLYLKRWTRMGQMRSESLRQLLLLAEPEAVMAAICAPGLDEELARRAWWCRQDAEHARRMLANPRVCASSLAPELAQYLIEYLPFETEAMLMAETVALVLQAGLITDEQQQDLWQRAARRPAYMLGFLRTLAHALPGASRANDRLADVQSRLVTLVEQALKPARSLLFLLSPQGQAFLVAFVAVLHKPGGQDVLMATLDALRRALDLDAMSLDLNLNELEAGLETFMDQDAEWRHCRQALPELAHEWCALAILASLGYGVLRPCLRDSTASGTLLKRRLEPLYQGLGPWLKLLQ